MLVLDFNVCFLILNISCGVYYYNKGQTHYYIQGLLMESSLATGQNKLMLLMEVCLGQFHHIQFQHAYKTILIILLFKYNTHKHIISSIYTYKQTIKVSGIEAQVKSNWYLLSTVSDTFLISLFLIYLSYIESCFLHWAIIQQYSAQQHM